LFFSFDSLAVISPVITRLSQVPVCDISAVHVLGKMPGAIEFTLTLQSTKVFARFLVVWIAAAFEAAYANWPELGLFMMPEIEVILIMELV
jgi:hypothetical protein